MHVLYDLSVRLGFSYGGFQMGAQAAGKILSVLEGQMLASERRAALLSRAFHAIDWSAPGASSFGAALASQFTAAGSAAQTAQERVDRFHRSMNIALGGAALTGAGLVMAGLLDKAGKAGAQLQVVMTGIGLATGATPRQLEAMQASFVPIGLRNQMSVTDVAHLALASTHAGITDLGQLRGSIATIANFAEAQQISTHVSRESAATTGVEYAHIFGAYTPQLLNPLINMLSKALTHTPLTGAGFEALVSQFGGMTAPLYGRSTAAKLFSQKDDTMMGVLLGQMGQGTRGGTQFGSGLIHLATAKPGTAAYAAEQRLETAGGGQFFNADGSFRGIRNLLEIINRAANVLTPGQLTAVNKAAFGTIGMKTFGNLEESARLQQWDVNARTFARIPGIDQQQERYNATPAGQSQQWHKNVETIVTTFGTALLPALLKVSQALAAVTRGVVEFMTAHPAIVQFAAGFALVATAIALIGGPILIAIGAIGMLAVAFGAMEAIAWPITAAILGITAAIAAGVLIFQHWSTVVAFLNDPLGALAGKFGPIGQGIAIVFAPLIGLIELFRLLWDEGGKLINWAGGLSGIGRTIGAVFGAIGRIIGGSLATFGGLLSVVGTLAGDLMLALSPLAAFIRDVLGAVFRTVGGWITTTFLRPIENVVLAVQGAIGWFLKWSKTITVVKDAVRWLGDKMKGFLEFLGVLHDGPAAHTVTAAPSVPTGVHALGGTTVGLPSTIPAVHLPSVPRLIGPLPRARSEAVSHPTSGHAGYVWHDPWAYTPPPVHAPPAPPAIPRKTGGMALIGAGSLHATQQTTEVHHHPVSLTMHINGADHATTEHLATVVAKRVRHEITASARWHNRYHGKGLLGMEPT